MPTPKILDVLRDIDRELAMIANDATKPLWSAAALRPRLQRQQLRIAHAQAHYRGFDSTVASSMELVVEMQVVAGEIEMRLQRRGILESSIKALLVLIVRILRVQFTVPLSLPASQQSWPVVEGPSISSRATPPAARG